MTAAIRRCRGRADEAPRKVWPPSESHPHAADGSPRSPSIVTPGASPPSISAGATRRHNDFCLPRPSWTPSAAPRYLVGYSAQCCSISRTARAPSSGSHCFGMTCILPTRKERGITPARPREEHRLLRDAIRRWASVDAERDCAPVTSAGPGSSRPGIRSCSTMARRKARVRTSFCRRGRRGPRR
jgi:hypothetical protein